MRDALSSAQKQIVTDTFARVRPRSDEVAALFYGRLFALAPDVRPLFQSDLREQGRKLMDTIGMAVISLSDLDDLDELVYALGRRHVRYGVQREHYPAVGNALLWALGEVLDNDFTPEAEAAWVAVYRYLSGQMMRAAEESPPMAGDDPTVDATGG